MRQHTMPSTTGFIVYNPRHYPLLTRLLEELGVASQPTTMSFSVRNEASGLEYNAAALDALFCQRRNLLSPRFLGMVRDLLRFYREAPALLAASGPGPSIGDYLAERGYGAAFRDEHLVPMASALWSSPAAADSWTFPARYLVQFMANHQMLQARRATAMARGPRRLGELRAGVAHALERSGAPQLPSMGGSPYPARCHRDVDQRRQRAFRSCRARLPQRPGARAPCGCERA